MSAPGTVVLAFAERFCTTRFRETVVIPALADLQAEWAEARPGRGRHLVRIRGYWSIVAGALFYAALLPARHVRENWGGVDAPAPALLRAAALSMLGYLLLLMSPGVVNAAMRAPSASLPLPLSVVSSWLFAYPMAVAVGLGRTLAGLQDEQQRRLWTRAALGLGVLAAFACLFVRLAALPAARRASYPPKAQSAMAASRAAARAPGASARGHVELSRSAVCLSLVALAIALAWSTHPKVLPLVVIVVYAFSHALVPAMWNNWGAPGMWGLHIGPVILTLVVGVFYQRPIRAPA
jgi:hypothetical protein